ncbi:hypothetical protein LZ30DRAFT_560751, partial [Colletotrichum cereale]
MHLATPLFLLLTLTLTLAAATPNPIPTPPLDDDDDDDDTVCPEGTIACGPVCVRANQRCCNDPFAAEFWSCESAQACGPSRKDGCLNPADQRPSPTSSTSPSPSPSPSSPPETPGPPTTTVSSTGTHMRTIHTRLSPSGGPPPSSQPTPTGADQQPPTCFFEVPLERRAPSEGKQTPCPTSLASSPDTPTGVPAETGAAALARHRPRDVAALAAAAA